MFNLSCRYHCAGNKKNLTLNWTIVLNLCTILLFVGSANKNPRTKLHNILQTRYSKGWYIYTNLEAVNAVRALFMMEPQTNRNQLRFNMEVPYSLNNLAVRHKKPQPILIEKCQADGTHGDTIQPELNLQRKLSSLSEEALREAQFLAQRHLKNQRYEEMRQRLNPAEEPAPHKSPTKKHDLKIHIPRESGVNHRSQSQNKLLKQLPVAGNSPPIRDSSKNRKLVSATTRIGHHSRTITKPKSFDRAELPTKLEPDKPPKSPVRSCRSVPGISFEKVDMSQVPMKHLLAMNQLVSADQVQGLIRSPIKSRLERQAKQRRSRSDPVRMRPASPLKRKVMSGDGAHRLERIYRSPVVPLRTTPSKHRKRGNASARARKSFIRTTPKSSSNLSRRRPEHYPSVGHDTDSSPTCGPVVIPLPDAHQVESRETVHSAISDQSTQVYRDTKALQHFAERVHAARSQGESRQPVHPGDLSVLTRIDEAKSRLEPLIKQAELLNSALRQASEKARNPEVKTPRFDTERRPYFADINDSIDSMDMTEECLESPDSTSPLGADDSAVLPSEKLSEVRAMLDRLDQMEQENLEIRRRWMTAKTFEVDNIQLDNLDVNDVIDEDLELADDVIHTHPKPVLLVKSKSAGATSKISSKTTKKLTTIKKKAKENPVKKTRKAISVPLKKTDSISEGKRRFEKHLKETGHEVKGTFDPWDFAKETADGIAMRCVEEVVEEIHQAGDDIVSQLYKDEFAAPGSPGPSDTVINENVNLT